MDQSPPERDRAMGNRCFRRVLDEKGHYGDIFETRDFHKEDC